MELWYNGSDTIIAENLEAAKKFYSELTSPEELACIDDDEWERVIKFDTMIWVDESLTEKRSVQQLMDEHVAANGTAPAILYSEDC